MAVKLHQIPLKERYKNPLIWERERERERDERERDERERRVAMEGGDVNLFWMFRKEVWLEGQKVDRW